MKNLINPTIFAIVATQPDGGIGYENDLIFKRGELIGDMKHFKDVTIEAGVVIMGRKTWDSFHKEPLPNRTNAIISKKLFSTDHSGVHLFTDPVSGLVSLRNLYPEKSISVIGGGEIYKTLFPYCEYIYASEAHCENRLADVFIKIPIEFREIQRHTMPTTKKNGSPGIPWDLVIYRNYKRQVLPIL